MNEYKRTYPCVSPRKLLIQNKILEVEKLELRQENLKLKKILLKNGLAKLRVKRNETN